ncbi:MAG: transposase [Roseiflexus sp.]
MSTEAMIIRRFCMGDDRLGAVKKRSDAHVHASEMVTSGLLCAVRGGHYRPVYRWLAANSAYRFPRLPELSRLLRLVQRCSPYPDEFLAEPSCFTVADTYGSELWHPRREGRSARHVGKQGKSHGRWMSGVTLGWLSKNAGKVVTWHWDTAKVSDRACRAMALGYNHEPIVLSDYGFRAQDAPHETMLFCAKGLIP